MSDSLERLQRLAEAYGVEGLDLVAEAIVARTQITADEQGAVRGVVALIVRDDGTLSGLESSTAIPGALRAEMVTTSEQHGLNATTASALVGFVLESVHAVLAEVDRSA